MITMYLRRLSLRRFLARTLLAFVRQVDERLGQLDVTGVTGAAVRMSADIYELLTEEVHFSRAADAARMHSQAPVAMNLEVIMAGNHLKIRPTKTKSFVLGEGKGRIGQRMTLIPLQWRI